MAGMCCVKHVVDLVRRVTVEPVMFLFMFASSLTLSAFMAMTYDKSCLALFNDTWCAVLKANKSAARQSSEENDAIQSLASAWIMRSNIAMTVLATVSLLLCLGSWGDRVGRRLPLVLPCVAAMAYSISNVLNATFMHAALIYTLIGPIFSGLGGSYLAVLMAGYTYLTDLSESGNRMKRVGVAESAVYISNTVSFFVSGLLVDHLGYVPTFAIALGCQTLALLYTLTLLPEIRTRDTTPNTPSTSTGNSVRCCQGACLDPLRDMWRFVRTARATRVKVHLALFIVVLDILQLCTTGENDILLLYLKRSPRNWTYTTYGYFKGAQNFTRGIAVLVLLPLLKKMASPRDTTLILAGLVSKMAGHILLGLAKETWTIFLTVAVACLQGFPPAGIRSVLSSLVFKYEQGRLFGVVASTECLVSFLATLIFNGVYPETLTLYDGLCIHLAACLVFVCLVIIMFQHIDLKASERSFETVPEAGSSGAVSDTSSQIASQHASQSVVDHSSLGSADVSSNVASGAPPCTNNIHSGRE